MNTHLHPWDENMQVDAMGNVSSARSGKAVQQSRMIIMGIAMAVMAGLEIRTGSS